MSSRTVRADFNALDCVVHYTRAAHRLGLWESERILLERFFPDRAAPLLEAGCGAGRATLALWEKGWRNLTAFDFAEELVEQAQSLAAERGASALRIVHADATRADLRARLGCGASPVAGAGSPPGTDSGETNRIAAGSRRKAAPAVRSDGVATEPPFAGALFLFNGLMQIPGRRNRRRALRHLAALVRPGGRLLFTTHDRDEPEERPLWAAEAKRWAAGTQDPRLREFGDRYFAHDHGRTFMHLPVRDEIVADLRATGWHHEFDAMRGDFARESRAVHDFSDNCRFWVAVNGAAPLRPAR